MRSYKLTGPTLPGGAQAARKNGHDADKYLKDVLTRLSTDKASRIDAGAWVCSKFFQEYAHMDAQFDKGLATRKQVMGEDFVANALGTATDFTLPIQH